MNSDENKSAAECALVLDGNAHVRLLRLIAAQGVKIRMIHALIVVHRRMLANAIIHAPIELIEGVIGLLRAKRKLPAAMVEVPLRLFRHKAIGGACQGQGDIVVTGTPFGLPMTSTNCERD